MIVPVKFQKFHEDNPHVYDQLEKLAFQAYRKGRKKIGIKMLFEVIRWNTMIQTSDKDFKLNNNYAPWYARAIMSRNPQLRGLFELREIRS